MHSFHLTGSGVGLLSASFFYSFVALQIPVGLLLDHFTYRSLVLIGIVLFILGLIIFSLAKSLTVAIMARVLMGFAAAPAVAAVMCLAANWFSVNDFMLVASLSEVVGTMGGLFGEGYMSHWVNRLGWRHSLWIWVAVGVVLCLLAWYWVYDAPLTHVRPKARHPLDREAISKAWCHLKSVMGQWPVWLNGLFGGLMFAILPAFAGMWGVPFCQSVFHLSFSSSAWLMSILFVGVIVGGLCLDRICTCVGSRSRTMRWATFAEMVALVALIAYASYPDALGKPLIPLGAMLFWLGFFAAIYIIEFANVRDLVRAESRGTAMAFANTWCGLIGAPILQPIFGSILHREHLVTADGIQSNPAIRLAFQDCLWILCGCALLAWLITWIVKPDDTVKPEEESLAELAEGAV